MASPRSCAILCLIIAVFIDPVISIRTSFIKLPSIGRSNINTSTYCESWRLAAETNNAGSWTVNPSICVDYIADYLNGDQYRSDYEVIADYALDFAKTVQISGDGKDVWIFDIDETLLTNIDYYKAHGYGSELYDSNSFNEWVFKGSAPAFDASLRLYNDLKKLGFTIVLLTGRDEEQSNITTTNLENAGYSGWERLLLRGPGDQGKAATEYKSEQRSKLIDEGFIIWGNTGDQWSDLLGFAVAKRSFKVANPMYYIP